ncbi:MAG: hypothetical protein RI100_07335 [Nitrosarchaeum sp.]|jgi:hypothetical protein|uniref:hypothetical protein n=1 Tax=Nitrosarchaeum sp. TaxID=2026886 RepID=UPI002DEC9409|nr:hypothetical protein [Nitrosarchaeum sp.]
MKFEEFWMKLQDELRHEKKFMTLKKKKKFNVRVGYNKQGRTTVFVTLETGIPRGQIRSNEFEGVWNNAKKYSPETRFVNKGKRLESYVKKNGDEGKSVQISYITTLINYIVQKQKME